MLVTERWPSMVGLAREHNVVQASVVSIMDIGAVSAFGKLNKMKSNAECVVRNLRMLWVSGPQTNPRCFSTEVCGDIAG